MTSRNCSEIVVTTKHFFSILSLTSVILSAYVCSHWQSRRASGSEVAVGNCINKCRFAVSSRGVIIRREWQEYDKEGHAKVNWGDTRLCWCVCLRVRPWRRKLWKSLWATLNSKLLLHICGFIPVTVYCGIQNTFHQSFLSWREILHLSFFLNHFLLGTYANAYVSFLFSTRTQKSVSTRIQQTLLIQTWFRYLANSCVDNGHIKLLCWIFFLN